MTTTTKIALGILGAAAAGVVIGMMIAPEKGSEMRNRIKRTAGEWADNVSHLFHEGKEEVQEAIGKVKQAKSSAEEKVNKVKESLS
jgi:gas vesicle protein